MTDLIEYIAKTLVDRPDDVVVREVESDHGAVIELTVSRDDIGKVIGKQGRIAKSMRTLLCAISARSGRHYVLEIQE